MRIVIKKTIIILIAVSIVTLGFLFFLSTVNLRRYLRHLSRGGRHAPISVVDVTGYKSSPSLVCPLLRTAINGGKVCPYPVQEDKHIGYWLHHAGVWEPLIVTNVLHVLAQCPGCIFIDIGANIGVFTISVAVTGRQVIAVEPGEQHLDRLVEGIRRSQVESNVIVVANAVSDRYQTLNFFSPAHNPGGNTALTDTTSQYNQTGRVRTIKINDLTTFFIDTHHAVLKIDIEGMEPCAIQGADLLFDTVDVKYVFMEWSIKTDNNRDQVQSMLDFFTLRGYRPCDVVDMRISLSSESRIMIDETKNWPHDIVWARS